MAASSTSREYLRSTLRPARHALQPADTAYVGAISREAVGHPVG
jgi:hypothetical protein